MEQIFNKILTNIDKEKGLKISNGASRLPCTDAILKVKDGSTGNVLHLKYVVSGRDIPIIQGPEWRNYICSYGVGATITLYTYEGPDDAS